MSERLKESVLKTEVFLGIPGFESLSIREVISSLLPPDKNESDRLD